MTKWSVQKPTQNNTKIHRTPRHTFRKNNFCVFFGFLFGHSKTLCTAKPRLSGHFRSRENFRIYEVSVFMKHDLFAHVVYVEC